jgi:hypothetical protein
MNVMGIDPGWSNLGWSCVEEGGVEVLCLPPYIKENVNSGCQILAAYFRLVRPGIDLFCLERQYGPQRFKLLQRYLVSALQKFYPDAKISIVGTNTITAHYNLARKYAGIPHKDAARLQAESMGLPPGRTQHEVDAYLLAQYGRSKLLSNTVDVLPVDAVNIQDEQ